MMQFDGEEFAIRPLMQRGTRYSKFIDAIELLLEIWYLGTDESLVLGCRVAL